MVEAEDQDAVVVDARVVKGKRFGWLDREMSVEIKRGDHFAARPAIDPSISGGMFRFAPAWTAARLPLFL